MPAYRKPSNVLLLSGAFKANPNRRRVDPTPRGPLGKAPRQGPITFRKAWELIAACAPPGVLADRDRIWLEVAASLFVQFRAAPAEFHPAKLARLASMLSALGLSPSDASRVTAAPALERNEFAE